jgi:hypothetical protein
LGERVLGGRGALTIIFCCCVCYFVVLPLIYLFFWLIDIQKEANKQKQQQYTCNTLSYFNSFLWFRSICVIKDEGLFWQNITNSVCIYKTTEEEQKRQKEIDRSICDKKTAITKI